jgi:hypothetical protein
MLESFVQAGYAGVSIETLWGLIKAGEVDGSRPYLVLRHDIDSDPDTGRAMWEIERGLGVEGSFFFRLSTLDVPLIKAIVASGSSASYHYEELATIAKRRRLRTRDEAGDHIGEAQEAFLHNITHLREITGAPMNVVASHGDFANRRLGVANWAILADAGFRRRAGVELETYDESVMSYVSSRHSDTLHPRYWIDEDPLKAIARGEPLVYVLVHPRHWRTARAVNVRDDLTRLVESIRYSLPSRNGAR